MGWGRGVLPAGGAAKPFRYGLVSIGLAALALASVIISFAYLMNLPKDVSPGLYDKASIAALPGFGDQKASIMVALLGKRWGVQPDGWREAAGAYGNEGEFRSVADVVDAESLQKVRAFKKQAKAAAKAG